MRYYGKMHRQYNRGNFTNIYGHVYYNKYNIKLNTKVCINLCKTCDAGVINLKC